MLESALHPPAAAEGLLRLFLLDDERFEKLGDFAEGFQMKAMEWGAKKAAFWYWLQVFRVIPPFIRNILYWSFAMFKNYFKIAVRSIRRHPGYSFLTIAGLALGMACCILILFWVRDERSTNTFHEKSGSLYLVRHIQHYGNKVSRGSGSVPALGPALREEFPEVQNMARFQNGQGEILLEYRDIKFKEMVQLADPEIFQLFSFPFISGNPEDAFDDTHVVVLSEKTAEKYFGNEDPVGKVMTFNGDMDVRIVGVMKNIPHNSTIRFDVWVPLTVSEILWRPNYLGTWYNLAFRTYLEMRADTDLEDFNEKISGRVRQNDPGTNTEPFIFPFNRIYLEMYGREARIRVFLVIAFVILFIACVNFMNLTTARSGRRAREVGMRKVVGASRRQVMRQFFGESILFTLLSLFLGIGLVRLLMPAFRSLTGKPLIFGQMINGPMLLGVAGIAIMTGVLAGVYPALFLSGFRPSSVLKGESVKGKAGALFRRILVVTQFALSVILIIGTVVIYSQVRYMKTKDLGFDREHLVYISVEGDLQNNASSMKNELLLNPGIQHVTLTSHSPTGIYNNGQDWDWEGRDPNINPLVTYFGVDPDFLDTFRMELIEGESFRKGAATSGNNVLVNETFAAIMDLPDIIGARLSQDDQIMQITGVVKDFHFTPVTREIGPLMIYHNPEDRPYRYMFIRLNPGNISET
ncbi:MAG: ABC transporter permease, partial [Candidatus Aminicenantes bacterium]|nr:ABC transporter permease [Candidatus Aminicenantes bacterium]